MPTDYLAQHSWAPMVLVFTKRAFFMTFTGNAQSVRRDAFSRMRYVVILDDSRWCAALYLGYSALPERAAWGLTFDLPRWLRLIQGLSLSLF
jgi:hypothetical protein